MCMYPNPWEGKLRRKALEQLEKLPDDSEFLVEGAESPKTEKSSENDDEQKQ